MMNLGYLLLIFFLLFSHNLAAKNYHATNNEFLCSLLERDNLSDKQTMLKQNYASAYCYKILQQQNIAAGGGVVELIYSVRIEQNKPKLILSLNIVNIKDKDVINVAQQEFVKYAQIIFSKYVRCKIAYHFKEKLAQEGELKEKVCGKVITIKSKTDKFNYKGEISFY